MFYIKKIIYFFFDLIFSNNPTTLKSVKLKNWVQLVWIAEVVGRKITLGLFERKETIFLLNEVKRDEICLDIGGNIGYYTNLFAYCVGSSGKVIVVEPNEKNFNLLQLNMHINGFRERVILENKLIGAKNEQEVNFVITADSAYSFVSNNAGDLNDENSTFKKKKTYSIDSILEKHAIKKVDIVKMDIEGYEYFALQGMHKLLSSPTGPRLIMMEICDENLKKYNLRSEVVFDYMSKIGYVANLLENGRLVQVTSNEITGYNNVFFKNK